MCRRCGEPDRRGSTRNRRARRAWLLSPASLHGGDGQRVPCFNSDSCGTWLTDQTLEVDRIIPAWRGGSYRRENIRPACGPCNRERNKGNPWTVDAEERRCLTG